MCSLFHVSLWIMEGIKPTRMLAPHEGYSHTVVERAIAKQSSAVYIVTVSKTSVGQKRKDTLKWKHKSYGTYSNKLSKPLARLEVQSKV